MNDDAGVQEPEHPAPARAPSQQDQGGAHRGVQGVQRQDRRQLQLCRLLQVHLGH